MFRLCYVTRFGSRWEIFGNLRKSLGNLRQSSDFVGNLWRSLEVFGNLRQSSEAVGKSSEIEVLEMKNLMHFTEKKLAGLRVTNTPTV